MIKFPQNFLWGAATSAYQVEGDNVNSDWWQWEKDTGRENSGKNTEQAINPAADPVASSRK